MARPWSLWTTHFCAYVTYVHENQRLPAGKRLQKTVENHHVLWENQLYMVIFNSYVSLPEGNW